MFGDFFYGIDQWVLCLLALALFYGGAELGFWCGRRGTARVNADAHPHVATIEGALLGLLALLLGFAFSMAMSRYDTRKLLVMEEANDIQTTYLRAQLLPDRYRADVAQLLKEYLDSRIAYYQAGINPEETKKALAWTESLQVRLWAKAVAAAREDPNQVTTGYFITSLNGLIDDHTKRVTAMNNHVPEVILVLLILVACMTIAVTGYSSGLKNVRLGGVRLILILLVTATLLIIVDLDRPRRGLITVSESNLIDVQQALKKFGN